MSNDIQKADQIAFHFYTKLFYVVNQARATSEPKTQGKIDKWFNLETPDSDLFTREAREPFKNISQAPAPGPPPLEIQVVLTVPELAHNQVLIYETSKTRIEPTPSLVVLETFTLAFTPHSVDPASIDVALPTIYKHGIPLFRSLFSLLRVLPSWKLFKRLKRRIGVAGSRHLGIQLRVRPVKETITPVDILTFDSRGSLSLSTQTHVFSKVPHPLGSLVLTVRYLSTPEFRLEELESVLSSRFISQDLDAGEGFVPTLTKNHQRDSSITSLTTRSPPKNIISRAVSTGGAAGDPIAVADKFILPARTASNPGAQIQPARQMASGDFVGYGATTATTAQSPSSGLAMSRMRKESMGSSTSSSFRENTPMHHPNPSITSLSSSPSSTNPMAIRRPNLNTVHPFKSNTVLSSSTAGSSSSPSLSIRQVPIASSPLSNVGLALAGSAHAHSRSTSVSSGSAAPAPGGTGAPSSYTSNVRHPPSPIGGGFARPSPPTTAHSGPSSSFSERRPGTSGSTGSGTSAVDDRLGEGVAIPPRRKRYSSSFGHRYSNSGGSYGAGGAEGAAHGGSSGRGTPANAFNVSTGSRESNPHQAGLLGLGIDAMGGSGGAPPERDTTLTSSNNTGGGTDDDDISIFVQDIEIQMRKPLSGRRKEREERDSKRREGQSPAREPVPTDQMRRLGIGFPGQAHDRGDSETTVRQEERSIPANQGARPAVLLRRPSSPANSSVAPSAPSSRFSTATGSSSTSSATVTAGSTATVVGVPMRTSPSDAAAVEAEASVSPPELSMSPTRMPMLTSQGEVEERLRKMQETFRKTLEGISGAGTNEAKRRERDRRREREKEREREREKDREAQRQRESRTRGAGGEREVRSEHVSRRNSEEERARASGTPPVGGMPSPRDARDDRHGPGGGPSGRGLSFRSLGGPSRSTPSSPIAVGGAYEDGNQRFGGVRDRDGGDDVGAARWVPYSLGMGLRRNNMEAESQSGSGSGSMLAGSTGEPGQGSEEVIGRMDITYEGPRSRQTGFRDRR